MKKRILIAILSIVMLVGLMPITAFAVSSDIIVGGANLGNGSTTVYYKNGDTSGNLTGTAEDYNAKLETVGGVATLTIKNLSVAAASGKAGIVSYVPLNLILEGANSITGGDDDEWPAYGIYGYDDLTISGDGSLSVTGGDAADDDSYGIYAYGELTINGGTISATGGTAAVNSYGIYAYGALTITGGTISATGGTAGSENDNVSCGISGGDGVAIYGGIVNAIGGTAGLSYGIERCYQISGGTVVATGGDAVYDSCGIIRETSNTDFTGGVVVMRGGTVSDLEGYNKAYGYNSIYLNGTKLAGQVVGGAFKDSSVAYDEDATAVAIVPNDYTVQNTSITGTNHTIDTNTAVVTPGTGSNGVPLVITESGSTVTLNGDLVLINLLGEFFTPAFTVNGDTTVSGSGSLTAIGAANKDYSYGISGNCSLSVDGAKIVAIGGPASKKSYGIGASVDVDVRNGGSVIAIGGTTANSYGISGTTTVNGGTITAIGGKASTNSYGINGRTTANGGTLNAIGGPGIAGESNGINGNVIVTGGALNALGGKTSSSYSCGISTNGSVSISGTGEVTAVGGVDGSGAMSYGIFAEGVNISGTGEIIVMGHTYGLSADGTLAAGSYIGGVNAVQDCTASGVNSLLATGYGYFAGNTQLTPGSSVTVGDPYQVVTVKEIPDPHEHPVCGSSHSDIGNHTGACADVTWTPVYSEADLGNMTAGGSYYLANDITLTHTLYVSSVNLCLNGFTLERTSSGHAIELTSGAMFNLCDCSVGQTGTIDGGYANDYAGIVCYNNNTLNIYGGTITGCQKGAAIGVMYSGTANIYNGNITGNNGGYGGVYCYNGATLNIYGGTITNNTADYAGGGIWLYKSTLNISGNVKISGNTLNGEENNVHIEVSSSDPAVLNVGALSSNAEIGITLGKTGYKEVGGSYEKYVEFKEGTISTTGAANIDRFFSDVDGYKIKTEGQGLKLVKIVEAKWGASKDSLTESGTLAAALSAAESSDTDVYIRLQTNAELVRPYFFENGEGVMITLDLNGYDITATLDGYTRLFGIGYVGSGGSSYGNLTLTDTSSGDKGSITVNTGTVYMCDGSTCHIGGGISIVSTSGYALRFEGGTATVEEGGFSVTSADSSAIYMNGATLNGNNIPFTAITNSDNYSTAAICVDQGDVTGLNATVTGPTAFSLGHSWYPSKFFNVEITGGTYTGTQYYAIVINNESGENSSLSLKGGTFVADTAEYGVINLYDSGTVLNTYGALLAENYAYTDGVSPAAITNETKLSEARTLVVKNKSELPTGKTIISIEKTATNGLVDTYTVTYDDGSTYEFTVTNGGAGQPGENGNDGKTPTFKIETGELKVSYDDGSTWTSLGNVTGTPGATGREVQLQVNGGYIQWKYEGDSAWTNLVSLETLVGSDGREVTFRVEDGNIQWQYVGDTTWTNLIPLVSLTGEKGDKGDDGREVTFQVANGYIQWKYVGDSEWINLVEIASLVGDKGDKGDVGDDGREVTFRTSSGYIQWQYVGDTEWTDLVELATLVGPKGEDGKTPTFKVENDVLYVSYDNGTSWTELGNIGGADGSNGQDGVDGADGITPTFKIENGELKVSYDNGTTWASLGNIQGTNGTDGTNGNDGQDGADGADGKTPTFKIENGELKVSYDNGATWTSLGNVQGADGTDGRNGSNGSNGKDGKDGKDGITPQLRINLETNEWEVSYDNGATWTSLGVKATGEKGDKGDKGDTGAAGADGKDGIDGKDGVDGKDGEVVTNDTDILVVVAIIISSIALIGEIVFLVYAIVKKKRAM